MTRRREIGVDPEIQNLLRQAERALESAVRLAGLHRQNVRKARIQDPDVDFQTEAEARQLLLRLEQSLQHVRSIRLPQVLEGAE